MTRQLQHSSTPARNTCRVCEPLGASMAFAGIQKCLPLIHGSQGCSTYIRRYMIGHFREPIDIASTNFTEQSAVFGGGRNFVLGVANIVRQYHPKVIGASTSCLAETMGEDMSMLVRQAKNYLREQEDIDDNDIPEIVTVRTASFRGSQRDGYFDTLLSLVQQLARAPENQTHSDSDHSRPINLLAPFCSPADLRHLKGIGESYGVLLQLIPDYSQSLDDGQWSAWQRLSEGGTTVATIEATAQAQASIEFQIPTTLSAGQWLEQTYQVPNFNLPLPIGVEACDLFFDTLNQLTGQKTPSSIQEDRERLIDSYVDAHKFVYGRKVLLFGDEEMVAALARFLCEIGMIPTLCSTGGKPHTLEKGLEGIECPEEIHTIGFADFEDLKEHAVQYGIDLMIGNSKGYELSRELGIPLIRVGFPIHDRIGGQRMQHLGYQGTQQIFDQVVNAIIAREQDENPVGYKTY